MYACGERSEWVPVLKDVYSQLHHTPFIIIRNVRRLDLMICRIGKDEKGSGIISIIDGIFT